jgi:cytochrome c5
MACGEATDRGATIALEVEQASTQVAVLTPRQSEMWARSCALCHVDGNAGAPRLGHAEEWAARLAQSEESLVSHTVQGFNDMPPLGYCMSCEIEDFRAMVQFMTTGVVSPGDSS